jgi:hypothetical protein
MKGDGRSRMTPYLDALERLGLPPTDPNTAIALGVTLRQVQRYAAGELEPPLQVMLLLRMYLKHPASLDSLLAAAPGTRELLTAAAEP